MLTPQQTATNVCYLETVGRRTGQPHEIEIWFASDDGKTLWFLSGGRDRSDWVRNVRANPAVRIRIGQDWFTGAARDVEGTPEEATARQLVAAKYYGWKEGALPNDWARNSLPIAVTLDS
ncbi:MAG: nitroreductase family deazaflavin-dependent oxidoreductase [Chloroflexota bacterium]|nr:nitroreductase family deazaflavin-dependent oxidoreductase [Chloroflexota bacterium]